MKINKLKLSMSAIITGTALLCFSATSFADTSPCKCVMVVSAPVAGYAVKFHIDTCEDLSDPSCQRASGEECHGTTSDGLGTNKYCSIAKVGGRATYKVDGANHTHVIHKIPNYDIEVDCTGTVFNPSCSNNPTGY